MANWLLAKDQRQHCCPTCCLGFQSDAELFVHLKHTQIHEVELLPSSQACCYKQGTVTHFMPECCASDLLLAIATTGSLHAV